jgi:hypothetical protein
MTECFVSPKRIAEILGVSRSHAYEIARQCVHLKAGRTVRVPESAWKGWLAAHLRPPSRFDCATAPASPVATRSARVTGRKRLSVPGISGDGSTIRHRALRT